MSRRKLTDEELSKIASRPDVGHAMLDRVDDEVLAFFKVNPGGLARIDFGHGTQPRHVSAEDWPAMRKTLRDCVVTVGRGERP